MSFKWAVGLVMVLCLSLIAWPAEAHDTLRFAALKDSGPQQAAKRVLTQAYGQLDLRLKFLVLPGQRGLSKADSGKLDGDVARIAGTEREFPNLIKIPVAISRLEGVYVARHDFQFTGRIAHIEPEKIGSFIGSKFVERHSNGLEFTLVPDFENLFRMLSAGRIDLIVAPRLTAIKMLQKHGEERYQILPTLFAQEELFHYVHERHAALASKLEPILLEMQENGDIERHWRATINAIIEAE